MVNVLRLDSEDVAIALGHTDDGELVRRLYGHRARDLALERVASAFDATGNVRPLRVVDHREDVVTPRLVGFAHYPRSASRDVPPLIVARLYRCDGDREPYVRSGPSTRAWAPGVRVAYLGFALLAAATSVALYLSNRALDEQAEGRRLALNVVCVPA